MVVKAKAAKMENELRHVLFVFEIAGLQYFSLSKLTTESAKKSVPIFRLLYMIFLLSFVVLLVTGFILSDELLWSVKSNVKTVIAFTVQNSMNVGMILVSLVSVIQSYCSTSKIQKVFLKNDELTQIYQREFAVSPNIAEVKRVTLIKIWFSLIFFVVTQLALFVANYQLNLNFVQFVLGMFPNMLLFLSALKFLFFVNMINYQLEFLMKTVKEFSSVPGLMQLEATKAFDNYVTTVRRSATNNNVEPLRNFQATWKAYAIIYENAGLINDSVGWTVLTIFFLLTVGLTVSSYELFVIAVGGMSIENLPGKLINSCQGLV